MDHAQSTGDGSTIRQWLALLMEDSQAKVDNSTLVLPNPCTLCGRDLRGGYHNRTCGVGGGLVGVHNSLRDLVHKCCANAGVQCRTERPGLLIDGEEKPADIFAVMPEGDTAFDVVLIDNRRPSDSDALKTRRRRTTRVMAKLADRRKRDKLRNGRRMEDRLRDHNLIFVPLAFEIGCAESGAWSKTLKNSVR